MCLAAQKVVVEQAACHRGNPGAHPPRRLDDDGDGQVHIVRVHQAHLYGRQPTGRHEQSRARLQPHHTEALQVGAQLQQPQQGCRKRAASCAPSCHASQSHRRQALSPVCPRAHRHAGVAREGGVHGVVRQHLRRHQWCEGGLKRHNAHVILESADWPERVLPPMPHLA